MPNNSIQYERNLIRELQRQRYIGVDDIILLNKQFGYFGDWTLTKSGATEPGDFSLEDWQRLHELAYTLDSTMKTKRKYFK
ncbi:MAG: hypothetical protein ACPG5Z_00130 [Pseudoalteromonas sp.]